MTEMIELSKKYCEDKHYGVNRRNKTPYYEHSFRVGNLISKLTKDEDIITAAYLHDVLEHGSGTEKEINNLFNEKVTDLVKEMTNDNELIKIKGKLNYLLDKINSMSEDSLLIKLCDRYDNLIDSGSKPSYSIETLKLIKNINRPLSKPHKKMVNLINSVITN